jgi:hypothetical protein
MSTATALELMVASPFAIIIALLVAWLVIESINDRRWDKENGRPWRN